jgi:hypothetical protein
MPKHLKLIARFANVGLTLFMVLGVLGLLGKGNVGGALFFSLIAVLLGFNLYLIEKSAMLLSEEEWLKSEVRKVFLRRKLARLAREEAAETDRR